MQDFVFSYSGNSFVGVRALWWMAVRRAVQDKKYAGLKRFAERFPSVINAQNEQGDTALIYATLEGCKPVFDYLLSRPGVDVNKANLCGDTAFILASWMGRESFVKKLLARPLLCVPQKNAKGQSAYDVAADDTIVDLIEKRRLVIEKPHALAFQIAPQLEPAPRKPASKRQETGKVKRLDR